MDKTAKSGENTTIIQLYTACYYLFEKSLETYNRFIIIDKSRQPLYFERSPALQQYCNTLVLKGLPYIPICNKNSMLKSGNKLVIYNATPGIYSTDNTLHTPFHR